jgi:hypothetical protein
MRFRSLQKKSAVCSMKPENRSFRRNWKPFRLWNRCRCGDDFCSSLYTAPKPAGAYGKGHRSNSLEPSKGMIILDVVDEKVVHIEVLYKDEVRETLDKLMS